MLEPWPSRLTAHALAVVGLLPCVLQVLITRCRPPTTPPFALICLTRIFAAASAGLSNGAMLPLESKAHPITIGFFASVAALPPVAPATAATPIAAPRSTARPPHLVVRFTAPPLVYPAPAVVELYYGFAWLNGSVTTTRRSFSTPRAATSIGSCCQRDPGSSASEKISRSKRPSQRSASKIGPNSITPSPGRTRSLVFRVGSRRSATWTP